MIIKITQIIIFTGILILSGCNRNDFHQTPERGSEAVGCPPKEPDIAKIYLFYLHGMIVEGSNGHPVSPVFGEYEYDKIIEEFANRGFVVISEIREKDTDIDQYSNKVILQIVDLLNKKVPARNIMVVGASKGGMIAAKVSNGIKNDKIKYVFLAGLFENYYNSEDIRLNGDILSIYDKSDQSKIAPDLYFSSQGINRSKSIVTDTGLGHGLIFKPNPIWIEEVVKWSEL